MLKLATVGTSWITSSFIEAALASGRWAIEYVYSREIGKARALLVKHRREGGEALDSLETLAGRRPDAVYIASPNSLHFEQSCFFLERGINVICEKPAGVSLSEWDIMERTAEQNGVVIIEAFRHISSPGFTALTEAVSRIGRIRNAVFSYNQYSSKYGAFLRGELPNVFNPVFAGGAMTDLGVYPISLAAALWGKPTGVRYTPLLLENGIDGAGSMILDYKTFLCNITFSKIADGIIDSEIIGEDGGVSFDRTQELSKIILRPRVAADRPKSHLSEYGRNTAEVIDCSAPLSVNKMVHEAEIFADTIEGKGRGDYYCRLLKISRDTHAIMDEGLKKT
jgi:predicted dehydrogenase